MQWTENLEKIGKTLLVLDGAFCFVVGEVLGFFFLGAVNKLGFLHFQVADHT